MPGLAWLTKAVAIAQWVGLSVGLILFNKWLMVYGGFPLPLCLVAMHMFMSFSIASAFRLAGYVDTSLSVDMIRRLVLPVGVLFASAVCTGNEAFLYLTVSFIQMVKAWTPAIVLLLSFFFGLEKPSLLLAAIVLITSGGVALAIYGELDFVLFGFVMIFVSVCLEALRLVMVELLYSNSGVKLSGLSGVYYTSPICFVCVAPVALYFEGAELARVWDARGASARLLLLNGVCAFMLNVSSLVLVKQTSALTLKVVGVAKDWLVIVFSAHVFNSVVQFSQWVGYSVAFVGIMLYTWYKYTQFRDAQAATGGGPAGKMLGGSVASTPRDTMDEEEQAESLSLLVAGSGSPANSVKAGPSASGGADLSLCSSGHGDRR